jgi:hypothetical protein
MGRSRSLPLAAALLLLVLAPGCSRYQIEGDGQGRIVRLDRLTGQVDYLRGTRFVRVENPGERRRELGELAEVKDWGAAQYDGKYALRLKTAFRNDRLYYQIAIAPTPPTSVFNFRIALNDRDGFQVANVSLNVPDGTPTTDGGILYSGFAPVDEDVYRSIASWSPRVEFYSGRLAPAELP